MLQMYIMPLSIFTRISLCEKSGYSMVEAERARGENIVKLFSETTNRSLLIFGMHHQGVVPYRVTKFRIRQTTTSCLTKFGCFRLIPSFTRISLCEKSGYSMVEVGVGANIS